MLKDSLQRAQATDPSQSFIVQAPAGSGKTEILTQRYLRLLGKVKAPEQIVALTFTRKAALEMRERIIRALQSVAAGEQAQSPHQQQTFDYAALALARAQTENWQILNQTGRLRIVTIDSLCQMLSQAIPLDEQQIPYAQITDNPQIFYQKAARQCLSYALGEPELQSALKCLLMHLDNRQDRLLELFIALLGKREQWLPSLYLAREQEKSTYEQMLASIVQHELARFQSQVPPKQAEILCSLSRQIALIENNSKSPRYALINWQYFNQIDRDSAAGLAALVLTSDDKLRKSFDHHVGLKRGACEDSVYNKLKAQSKELLASLALEPDFLNALIAIKNLPDPHYDPDQWQVLQALFHLLPFLVGHLQLVFSEQNEVDFSAISQQALIALGDEDQPTDLALYLDNNIQHLLVDEFQDTSIQQYQLLSHLVRGWQPEDGRTLFIVGDPMQSIYRFRQAEVGLFLKAKKNGLGPVTLKSLELCCNFRSTPSIINWVNSQFQRIFPQRDDIESGAISFHFAVNVQEDCAETYVKAFQLPNRKREALAITETVKELLQNHPNDNLAILVRSRNQLTEITTALREQQIPFQGVEIEHLAKLSHLRDLWSLTQALLLPANRLAWLALLRSPFCGLMLNDIFILANFDKRKSILYALANLENISNLSEDGRCRAQFIYSVLSQTLACRHQESLSDWVAHTLKNLQVDLILNEIQQNDLEQYWLILDRFSRAGQPLDLEQFEKELDKLYSQRVNHSRLQVMTIHKSKGLEFDTVILPSLSACKHAHDQPLLRWLKLPSQTQKEVFLVSPIKAADSEVCLVYNYLAKLDAEKESYELQRLFYVAATRAKKRLYLFDNQNKERKNSFRNLLKDQEFISNDKEEACISEELLEPTLSRLPVNFYVNLPKMPVLQTNSLQSISLDSTARHLGIICHELLQWICDKHPESIEKLPWAMVVNRLRSLGFSKHEQQESLKLMRQQLDNLFSNPIGQWLTKAHKDEQNEYELLVNIQGLPATRIIDRTFIDQGTRWVIDFKTGTDDDQTQTHHRHQVNLYAELLATKSAESIRCGLYYLASGKWVNWTYLN
ncbi:MAG: UvrD-helicase domain-containing protein [Tatlockia sp.]|nr:UvrD-helicase domain-containing protein [Tatlockia sp.]